MESVDALITRCLALPVNVIATVHETEEEAADSSAEKKTFTGRVGVYPARYQLLFKYFNEVWHLAQAPDPKNPQSQAYLPQVQVKPNYRCPWVKTVLDVNIFQPPNIEAILAEHYGKHPKDKPVQTQEVVALAKV